MAKMVDAKLAFAKLPNLKEDGQNVILNGRIFMS